MTHTPLRALAGAVLALGLAGTLLAMPSTATAAPPAAPRVGECHALTMAEADAVSDPDRPVSCAGSHTTRTIKVIKVTRRVAGDLDLALRAALKGCQPALDKALGSTAAARELSAYNFLFFAPTKAQLRQGPAWVRCDLALYGGRTLLPLPTDETPALGALPHPDGVARCGVQSRSSFLRTACTKAHTHRARQAFKVNARRYPGDDALFEVAKRRCPRVAGRDFYATWPSAQGWRLSGDRYLVCFSSGR